jgi:hypothetical protein
VNVVSNAPQDHEETPKETSDRIIREVAEETRTAVLNQHIRDTLDEAQRALRQDNPDKAMDVLAKASRRYVRLGGPDPDPRWVPADQREQESQAPG